MVPPLPRVSLILILTTVACSSHKSASPAPTLDKIPEGHADSPAAKPPGAEGSSPGTAATTPGNDASTSAPSELVAVDAADLPNYHRVDGHLFRSGRPTEKGVEALKKQGVKTVLSLEEYVTGSSQADREAAWVKDHGMTFLRIPMNGLLKPKAADIAKAVAYLRDPANQPALVHCQHGSDRTGEVVAAYHILNDGWDVAKAKADMRDPHYGHSKLLYWWDDVLDEIKAP